MKRPEDPLPTRTTLLRRVQNRAETTKWQNGWEEFYELYCPLISGMGRKAGLSAEDADDLVVDVMAELCERIAAFEPNRNRGPFKAWLLNRVRWRIKDKVRARGLLRQTDTGEIEERLGGDVGQSPFSDEAWAAAWREQVLETAIDRVRAQADPRQFQIFNACTTQKIRAQKVAASFGVSIAQVYLAKHRVGKLVKREVERLTRGMEGDGGI